LAISCPLCFCPSVFPFLFLLSAMRILLLLLFLLCVAVSQSSALGIPFCSGTQQLREYSNIKWNALDDGSLFLYQFCTTQRRLLSSVRAGRVKVNAVNLPFSVCESDMDCVQQSITKNSDGLYCFSGRTHWDFPLYPSPSSDTTINVQLLDVRGNEIALFCATY
jgi:hypothetical protein